MLSRITVAGPTSLPFSPSPISFMKIFDAPRPSRNLSFPAASCNTRASIAICTGCRVYGEMIPHPMVIRFVSRAAIAVIAVEDRASIECLRHHGYASANQKVSNPAASHA